MKWIPRGGNIPKAKEEEMFLKKHRLKGGTPEVTSGAEFFEFEGQFEQQ